MNITIESKIKECTSIIDQIENIEFRLIAIGLGHERDFTRLVKRALIFKQTALWNELDASTSKKKVLDEPELTFEWKPVRKPRKKKKK